MASTDLSSVATDENAEHVSENKFVGQSVQHAAPGVITSRQRDLWQPSERNGVFTTVMEQHPTRFVAIHAHPTRHEVIDWVCLNTRVYGSVNLTSPTAVAAFHEFVTTAPGGVLLISGHLTQDAQMLTDAFRRCDLPDSDVSGIDITAAMYAMNGHWAVGVLPTVADVAVFTGLTREPDTGTTVHHVADMWWSLEQMRQRVAVAPW